MSSLRRSLRKLRLSSTPTPTKAEQAASQILDLEDQAIANLHNALQTLIKHTEGSLSGTWACHNCRYQNAILLLPEDHPLGILKCECCEHICCGFCAPSGLMKQYYTEGADVRVWNEEYRQLPYVSVCRDCGLSWRAVIARTAKIDDEKAMMHWGFGNRKCVCGAKPSVWNPWTGFRICEPEVIQGNTQMLLKALRASLNAEMAG